MDHSGPLLIIVLSKPTNAMIDNESTNEWSKSTQPPPPPKKKRNYMYFSSHLQLFVQVKIGKREKTSNMFLIRQHDQTAKDFSIPGTGCV